MPDANANFGRRHAPDERDRRFPFRQLLDRVREVVPILSGSRHYAPGPILDQGATGTCVAHAWASWAYGEPLMTRPSTFPTPYNLYREIVQIDEWADNDHEATAPDAALQSGTSVRAGIRTLQARGHVARYLWTWDVAEIREWHLAGLGTVTLGSWWRASMMRPDADQIIYFSGRRLGGHAYKSTGWSDAVVLRNVSPRRTARGLRIQNSWGPGWGYQGRAWILEDDLAKLLADEGECCAAVQQDVLLF